jgi:hypothetical protein
VTLYSVEECDGVAFLTMEPIEGQPLDRMISENGLPVEPSPSTPWMDSLPPIGASRLRTSATGSEVALWRNGLRGSIRIIPDGIGSPCSSMRTVSATTKALDVVLKVNMPAFWRTHFALATAYAQLGERDAASNAVRALLTIRPDFPVVARNELRKWWDAELIQHLIDGLRRAGLEIAGDNGAPPAKHAAT